jgi:hypothetical protein
LPMPDSSSNDGQEDLEFSQTFGSYTSPTSVAIGLVLHYTRPNNFSKEIELYDCAQDPQCKTRTSVAQQADYGTLRLSFTNMEDPSDTLGCDHHIRLAHRKMMEFLGSGHTAADLNYMYYYVDLRDKNGVYNLNCYPDDPQNPATHPSMHLDQEPVDVTKELGNIVSDLEKIGDGRCPQTHEDKVESNLGCGTLKRILQALKGHPPSHSQYGEIDEALHASIADIDLVSLEQLQIGMAGKHAPSNGRSPTQTLLEEMRDAQSKERKLDQIVIFSSTSGKDCRVGQMQIHP